MVVPVDPAGGGVFDVGDGLVGPLWNTVVVMQSVLNRLGQHPARPLADLRGDVDLDELADQVLQTWFRFSMSDTGGLPPVNRYAWPKHPDVQGLAGAVRLIQHDRSEFFSLLAGADHDNVNELIREHDGLHSRDVWALLQVPLLTLLDQRDPS